jgi:transposase
MHYKQRAVIEFLVAGKESVGNIHKRLCPVYGRCAVDRSTVGRWVQRVKASGSGEMELHDRPWSGRPATATSPDMLQRADDIIHADRRITSRQLAVQLSVSIGSAMAIIDALEYSKVCARWVPRSLTTQHRRQRKAICSELLERFGAEGGGRPFCPGSSQVMKPGLTIMSQRRKGSQWSGIIHNHQEKRSSRQLLPPERS